MYVAVPIYAIIDAADLNEAAHAKEVIEQLLQSDMLKGVIMGSGIRLQATTVGDPYECQPPQPQQPQQQQPVYNGRR